jgi:hypothetical protein
VERRTSNVQSREQKNAIIFAVRVLGRHSSVLHEQVGIKLEYSAKKKNTELKSKEPSKKNGKE